MAEVKVLRRLDTSGVSDDFALEKGRYGVGVSWDEGARKVDIDLQCVVVDNNGVIIDCAYYNNLKAARSITHSGDEVTGAVEGIDELVWVGFRKLPETVHVLIFVVAAYTGGHLKDVTNGRLHVFEERQSQEVATFEMESSDASVDVVCAMFREGGGWKLRIIDEPAQKGQHFMDILPLLAETVRLFIPSAPKRQKVAFAMEKGGVLDLPQDLASIRVGLGWDVDDGEVDLDVSAVLIDQGGKDIEAVFFGRLESDHGIVHSGDNQTGEGEGDDEEIVAQLTGIGPQVQQVFFVVNIYTRGRNFSQVANPYCRIVDDGSGAELCRYSLRDAGQENGLIIAKIAREAGGRWGFHALGLPCKGTMYRDSLPQIRATSRLKTASLMPRGGTTDFSDLGGCASDPSSAHPAHHAHQARLVGLSAPPPSEPACCAIQ